MANSFFRRWQDFRLNISNQAINQVKILSSSSYEMILKLHSVVNMIKVLEYGRKSVLNQLCWCIDFGFETRRCNVF